MQIQGLRLDKTHLNFRIVSVMYNFTLELKIMDIILKYF